MSVLHSARRGPSHPARGRVQPVLILAAVVAVLALGAALYLYVRPRHAEPLPAQTQTTPPAKPAADTVQLSTEQVKEVSPGPVLQQSFAQRRDAIGIIDFDQDRQVQVFSPYQGRIAQVRVKAGDDVAQNQVLYTVLIPDLAQAASTLISTAGVLKAANETLARAQALYQAESIAQKELQQNQSDQQAADAAYRAARKSLLLFGLSESDIAQIEKERKIDIEMPVRSPMRGRVTARNAAPGLVVQPGAAPAPVTVSDLSKLWMVASVPESEIAAYRLGQKVSVSVAAYPKQSFNGQISYISDSSDPNTHRINLRAELVDAQHLLRPQMQATFRITVGESTQSPAVPENALARESDGSFSAWVSLADGHFQRRTVQPGMTQDGMVQILQGLKPGEQIARDKALFLSNLAVMGSSGN